MGEGHALRRTSPKGGPFIGTCMKCGTADLPLSQMHKFCTNPANLSADETLLLALRDSDGSGSTVGDSAGPQDTAQ